MTTPIGTISLLNIQDEFGGSIPIGLNEYYAGGANVPAGTAGVPTSGTISMNNLRGKSKATPLTSFVSPNTTAEGNTFFVFVYDSGTIYPTIYWRLTNYTNLQDSDFNNVSGSINYDYIDGSYPTISFTSVTDATFEGIGTFNLTLYSNAAHTVSVGSTTYMNLTDTYSTGGVTVSRDTIYRYANKNASYRSSTVSLTTSGIQGSLVYYEVYTTSGTLNSADLSSPNNLTNGSVVVPSNGTVSVEVQATDWNGTQDITTNKTLYVRFRLGTSTGTILGTSSAITLLAMPSVSFSFSPTTIREGQSATVTGSVTNIPYDGSASFFWRQSTTFGTAIAADWLLGNGSPGTLTGELIWNTQIVQVPIYAAIDSVSEGTESLAFFWYTHNVDTGNPFWLHSLDIQSPAQITSAAANYSSVQITNISSYPVSRTFTVNVIADSSTNTTSSLTVPANQISSNAISPFSYTATDGTAGTYNMQYQIVSPSHETYTITNFPETFVFPVYGVEFFFTGTNSSGSARTLIARVTSVPSLGYSRTFSVEFRARAAGTSAWGAWGAIPGNVVITVGANATSSINTTLYSATGAAQFDFEFRLIRGGHETKYSPVFSNIWLG